MLCVYLRASVCARVKMITADDDALGFSVAHHGVVSGVGDGEDVRRQLAQPSVLVELDVFGIIDRVELERVDGDENGADVGVDVAGLETGPQIVHQRFLVQVGQLAQVGVFTVARLIQETIKIVANQLRVGV